MDDLEFLRSMEGERNNEESLVAGAEHLLRLKKQVGSEVRQYDDLELEKKAGELSGILAAGLTPTSNRCPGCKKEKNACLCKMASILVQAREKTAGYLDAAKGALAKNPTLRAAVLGGGVSGAVGAGMGAITSPGDRVGGAVKGGWTGTLSGAGAGALYHHLNAKLAGMREKTAASIVDSLKNVNPGLVAATGLGAVAGGLGTYLASRPQKDTGKGRAEEELEGKVEAQKSQPERGLLSKMHRRNTELEHGYAKAFREHPISAAALGTATGALSGYSLGRLAGAVSKVRGGK